jgi:hypothetical protein
MATRCFMPPDSWRGPGSELTAGQPHRVEERHDLRVPRRPEQAREPAHGAPDQAPHGVRAVEGRIRVLEDDLQRLDLLVRPRLGGGVAGEHDATPGIGLGDAEEEARERRLAGAGFADEAQRFAGLKRQRHVAQGPNRSAAGLVGLGHGGKLQHRRLPGAGAGVAVCDRAALRQGGEQGRDAVVEVAAAAAARTHGQEGRRHLAQMSPASAQRGT